jgi:hypothetical protein
VDIELGDQPAFPAQRQMGTGPSWLQLTSARVNNGLPRLLAVRGRLRAVCSRGLDWRPQSGSH